MLNPIQVSYKNCVGSKAACGPKFSFRPQFAVLWVWRKYFLTTHNFLHSVKFLTRWRDNIVSKCPVTSISQLIILFIVIDKTHSLVFNWKKSNNIEISHFISFLQNKLLFIFRLLAPILIIDMEVKDKEQIKKDMYI